MSIVKLKAVIKEFEEAQEKWANCGASDSEPDGVFQSILIKALRGKKPKIPSTVLGWEIYSANANSKKAAKELHNILKKAVAIIEACPIGESGKIKLYLEDYCWRVD